MPQPICDWGITYSITGNMHTVNVCVLEHGLHWSPISLTGTRLSLHQESEHEKHGQYCVWIPNQYIGPLYICAAVSRPCWHGDGYPYGMAWKLQLQLVYWCMSSKWKAPWNLFLNEQHLFMGGFTSFQYMDYFGVPKMPSQHDYDLNNWTNMQGIIMAS